MKRGSDVELVQAEQLAFKNMEFLALCADIEGLAPPPPGPNYAPPDYGQMTGTLSCKACGREIRLHTVTEWHPRL